MIHLNGLFRFLIITIVLTLAFPAEPAAQVSQVQREKIQRALQFINYYYIEELDEEKLVEDAIRGMLSELDPHSVYLSADELRRSMENLQGSFEGIGIQFNLISDTIVVISPIPGGPSDKVGLMAGDKIIYIDGEKAHGSQVNNQFVQDRLRGERGSRVEVSIYRTGASELLDFTIVRDRIPINSVDAAFMAAPGIGYIKLNRFARTSMREYRQASQALLEQGMEHLILDLNYNSGGFMDVAIDLADQFLERDKLIVYQEGHASPRQDYNSTFRGNFMEGKLVVLINEGSASASEIVAGAVQDWDRGLLIGRRSFGKGLVQRPFELPDGSAIRLTTATYHTPTGRSIQKPYDQGAEEYYRDLSERLSSGELVSPENITFPDSLQYFTKRNQRTVYGGGGIMPDFFIPLDTNRVSEYYSRMTRRGVLNHFGIEYTNQHRQHLNESFPELDSFISGFHVDQDLLDELHVYAAEQGIEPGDEEQSAEAVNFIQNQLKALIARNLFDFSAFTQIIMQRDPAYLKAIEVIEDGTFDRMQIHY